MPFRSPVLERLLLCLIVGSAASAGEERPNFLFILADDQAPETLSCYGNTVCQTPHLDRLAAEGMVFDDAHHMGSWSGAVCTPSRTMIMTGRTVWRIPGAKGPGLKHPEGFRKDVASRSLPATFNGAGYDTYRTCKNGNSFKEANKLFAESDTASKRDGTPEGGSEWHGDRVVEYLIDREERGDEDPFLIYFGFSHPHDPRHATPELAEKYGANNKGVGEEPNPKAPPLQINYLPAHPFPHGHPGLRDEERVQGVMKRRDVATIRNEVGREYACIENIDIQVGRVLERLEATGELDNTYIFYTADHGIAVGRHGLLGKQSLYEHSVRVPLVMAGPGIPAGVRSDADCYLHDIYPTLCGLIGLPLPDSVEGRSLLPILRGERDSIRDSVFYAYGKVQRGVRCGRWKLIQYHVKGTRTVQLFDVKDDPFEINNLAGDPGRKDRVRKMTELLREWMRHADDICDPDDPGWCGAPPEG